MRYPRCGGKFARRPCRVKYLVMRAAEKLADSHAAFIADDCGGQKILAAEACTLGDGKHCGKYDRAGMQHRAVVQIILLDIMRSSTVDERSEHRRSALARHQDF